MPVSTQPKGTGEKNQVIGMLNQMQVQEQKLKEAQDLAIQNVLKDQKKQKKYEEEINKIKADYEETREKDGKVLEDKIKTEIEFSVLRISEKRYKAEAEAEELKKQMVTKDATIAELMKQVEALTKENSNLKYRVHELETIGNVKLGQSIGNSNVTSPKRGGPATDITGRSVIILLLINF